MGECITEAEVNADNRVDLIDGETDRRFFPPTAMVWTTIQRAKMEDIYKDATGAYPEEEEEEFQLVGLSGDSRRG